jgi:uncharacterized protein
VRFEWDPPKADPNVKRHGVWFEEAQEAFADEFALVMGDPDHSDGEDRFILPGASASSLLVVCHCYREDDEVVRIFSARRANKAEQETYRQRR